MLARDDRYFRQQTTTDDYSRSTFDSHRSTQRIDGTGDTHYQGNRSLGGNGWTSHWTLRQFEESEVEHGSYYWPLFPEDDRPNSYNVTIDHSAEASADTPIPYGYSTNPPVNLPPAGSLGPGGFATQEDSQAIRDLQGQVAMNGSAAASNNAARDAAFAELAEETESSDDPGDESTTEPPSASSVAATYVNGQGSVPMPGNPTAVASGAATEANESGMVGGRGDLCERFPETCTERPLARFGGTVEQLTLGELQSIINGKLASLEQGKKLYGGGLVTKVTTTTGEEFWFVPVMGVDPQGNLVVKGTAIYNDIKSVETAVKKISDLAWLAAAGQSLRDIAATADVGTLPGVGQAANQVRKSIAARKAASVNDLSLGLRQQYTDAVAGLKGIGDNLLRQGLSKEDVARQLHAMRRQIGVKFKDMTPPDLLEYIYKFNIDRYGDKLGPTFESLIAKGKTFEQIIDSAPSPLGDVKQLGAALHKHFGDEILPLLRKYDMLP